MRTTILLAGAAMTLASCGDSTAPMSAGSVATTAGSSGSSTADTFVTPASAKSYDGIGAVQHYEYSTRSDSNVQSGQLYAGDAGTARDGGFAITYDPRDAIFDITITRAKGLVSTGDLRFQDPAHRTNFGGAAYPQAGTANLVNVSANKQIQYLQSGTGGGPLIAPQVVNASATLPDSYVNGDNTYASVTQTFFYQKPGTTTQYVTYAGFLRNNISTLKQANPDGTTYLKNSYSLDRAVFAWGQRTDNSAVPKSGTATYTGDMLATMVFNPLIDQSSAASTYFQWIDGSHTTQIDFGKLSVSTKFTGVVTAPALDAYTNGAYSLPGGSTFAASSSATIDLVNKGGFSGTVSSAGFTTPKGAALPVNIAGSSVDGAFFGPNGEEIGGSFRIVGGTPDQRIDILGAFTGKK